MSLRDSVEGFEVIARGPDAGQVGLARTSADLTLGVYEPPGDEPVPAELTYPAELFDPAAARRITDGLLAALAAAVADPHRPLSEILGSATRPAAERNLP